MACAQPSWCSLPLNASNKVGHGIVDHVSSIHQEQDHATVHYCRHCIVTVRPMQAMLKVGLTASPGVLFYALLLCKPTAKPSSHREGTHRHAPAIAVTTTVFIFTAPVSICFARALPVIISSSVQGRILSNLQRVSGTLCVAGHYF